MTPWANLVKSHLQQYIASDMPQLPVIQFTSLSIDQTQNEFKHHIS